MRAMGKWGLQGRAMPIGGVKSDQVNWRYTTSVRENRDEKRGRKIRAKRKKKNGDTALYVGWRSNGSDSRQ